MKPTSTLGRSTDRLKVPAALPSADCTVLRNAPNSAVAASTAVAMAIPLVIALVVLPTASRRVSTCAPSPSTSPDISAMPWALSETGPNVSIETMTPTVVSSPGRRQRHREQRDGRVAGAEQEGTVDRGRDQQRRVHG